jgi:hypothetical protein
MIPSTARRDFLKAAAVVTFLSRHLPLTASEQTGKRRPNIIFILGDDLGWAELGCYGNTFNETPNLDKLAREGVRFTQPTRRRPSAPPTGPP